MKKLISLPISILILTALTACGGGGTDGESNNDDATQDTTDTISGGGSDDSSGTGGCVNFPKPVVGLTYSFRNSFLSNEQTRTHTSVGATIWTDETVSSAAGNDMTVKLSEHFTTSGGYRHISKTTSETTLAIFSGTFSAGEENFSPPKRIPVGKVCEGQTWTDSFTQTTKDISPAVISGGQIIVPEKTEIQTSQVVEKSTIEAINVSKKVEAGTFNTFRLRIEGTEDGVELTIVTWIDIKTGIPVLLDILNDDGSVFTSIEASKKPTIKK